MHIYDYIVIGSGLTWLTIAKKINQETDNILILEAQDSTGGDNRPTTLNDQIINNGLRFFPDTAPAQNAIKFLENLLDQPLVESSIENQIETYESSGFKKFLGFGDNPPEFYEQLSYFLNSKELKLIQKPHEWTQQLATRLDSKILKKSIVTKFGFEELDSEEPKLTHVLVNGSKQIYAHNFIFTGQPKELALLVPDELLNARLKAKLKKSITWQGVCLDLFHSIPTDKTNMFLLNGTTNDDIGPCIGRFLPAVEGVNNVGGSQISHQISQWMSFVDSESAEDTENIGLILKKMKRQIKRAFPEQADSIKKEKIFVTPVLSGTDLKLNANGTLPKVKNLWIASSQLNSYQNLLGSLMQAQLTLAALGFVESLDPESITNPESISDLEATV